jgi:transcriptional regulator with GAF, ATPase, and Fis domain
MEVCPVIEQSLNVQPRMGATGTALHLVRLRNAESKIMADRALFPHIVGASAKMQEVFRLIERAAPSKATVLIRGESGTGKELVARALHQRSARSAEPFVAMNCGAIPETLLESELFGHERGAFTGATMQRKGRFELAAGGTLFLDEIGHLSPALQVKLLRVLQEREFERVGGTQTIKVDVRVIAATNVDLERAVADGAFREDLYYRLRVIEIFLPPLRERMEDLPALARYFLQRHNERNNKRISDLSAEAWGWLSRQAWQGNVRELENAIERAVVLSDSHADTISADLMDSSLRAQNTKGDDRQRAAGKTQQVNVHDATGSTFEQVINATERRLILKALAEANGNQTRAATRLGLSLRSLRHYMQKHGITKHNWLAMFRAWA